jgi:trehalose 6-phosphate synthase
MNAVPVAGRRSNAPMQSLPLSSQFLSASSPSSAEDHPARQAPRGGSGVNLQAVPGLAPRGSCAPLPPRRLVVVSNRVVDPHQPAAGGLVMALSDLMKATDGVWFGWSGDINDGPDAGQVRKQAYGRTTLAQVDLSKADHDHYYAGFANALLWPVFHDQLEHADFNEDFFRRYEQVNQRFAATLSRLLKPDDVIWVHDYHLILLAAKLRRLGCRQRIGFFNHIPFPTPAALRQIPQHEHLVRSLFAYDVIGMQAQRDLRRFHEYVAIQAQGRWPDAQHVEAFGQTVRVQHLPVGINVEKFTAQCPGAGADAVLARVRAESGKRTLMVAADRLDYTKGLPERLAAFRQLLECYPDCHGQVTLLQIAAPSRESVAAYVAIRKKVDRLVETLNADYGFGDWTPVMHIDETVDRAAMPEIFSLGRVGLVTPVADGMNLVAKEYVAAQDPRSPGVLELSERAGASEQLTQALMLDPGDPAAMAEMFHRGLCMPLKERRARHASLQENVQKADLHWWHGRSLGALGLDAAQPAPGPTRPDPVPSDAAHSATPSAAAGPSQGG